MGTANRQLKKVLVVCTGNSCRSPMAAGWLNQKLTGKGWMAESAGVAAGNGAPATPEAVAAMRELGIDISGHRSRALTRELAAAADLILALTADHRREIVRRFPAAAGKVHLLDSFGPGPAQDVPDPIGLPADVYRHTRDELVRALGDFVVHLAERGELRNG